MNRTTLGLMLFAAGLVFGSAEPIDWNLPVGIAAVVAGLLLMRSGERQDKTDPNY